MCYLVKLYFGSVLGEYLNCRRLFVYELSMGVSVACLISRRHSYGGGMINSVEMMRNGAIRMYVTDEKINIQCGMRITFATGLHLLSRNINKQCTLFSTADYNITSC